MIKKKMKQLTLKFDGEGMGHSVDAFDLASTIIAFGRVIEEIANINYLKKDTKLQINVNAFKEGSFDSIFDLSIIEVGGAVLTAAKTIIDSADDPVDLIISTFKQIVDLKKFLQGKPPKSIELNANNNQGNVTVFNFNGDNMHVDLSALRTLQQKSFNANLQKMAEAIEKNETIDSLSVLDGEIAVADIKKSETTYFNPLEDIQTTDNHRIKGTVSRLDSKTETGSLSVGDKRISFDYSGMEDDIKGTAFLTLIESMKHKIAIYLIGNATFDLESNLKKIQVKKVESDAKLF